MWLTSVAIKRPLFMLMVIGALLVVGLVSWTKLGVDLLPALDFPIVVVNTSYPGASPDAVDTLVTKPVEDAVATINDIDYIQSTSVEGQSSVVIFFTDKAAKDSSIDVERRVSALRNQLPTDAKDPTVGKYDPNAQPILLLTLSGNRDLGALERLGEDPVQKRLEGTDGVAQVSLVGGLVREIDIQVDQQRLQARSLSILQVNQALAGDNVNVPAGSITQQGRDWTVRLDNQAQTPSELNNVLVSSTTNGPVYLKDVATVVDTYKKVSTIQRTNGQSAVGITVLKQASANTVATAESVKATLKALQPDLPQGVHIDVAYDASIFTRRSLNDVTRELSQAVILTGLVLLLFLHTFRSTLIVLLAIPTSLIATLGVMYFLGLSLNMMSLMGLTLTVGILVDDSIVVLENIFRHLQLGEAPREAAIHGRSEIGFAAIAITLVDIVVFTPIAFMSGIVGQYFREFGLVIVSATCFSLVVSFTLTPLLASRWYRRGDHGEAKVRQPSRNPLVRFGRAWDAGYARLARGYARVLRFAIGRRTRWAVVVLSVLSFIGGIMLVATGVLSTEFFPNADNGALTISLEMPPGTSVDVTNSATQKIEQRVMAWPEVKEVFTSVGQSGGFGPSQSRLATMQVQLVDKNLRTRTPDDLTRVARTYGADIPGAKVTASPVSQFGGGGASAVSVRIQGEDQAILTKLASQVADVVRRTPGTADVNDGGVTGDPELVVNVDRQQAADLGLTPSQVASVLRTGLAGSIVGTFRPQGTIGWDISVILNPDERARVEQVGQIPIVTPRGQTIQLGQIANVSTSIGPTQIDRRDRQRSVYVTADLQDRPAGDVAKDIQAGLDKIRVPNGYKVTQGGDAQSQNETFGQILTALGLSVLLMYMLMVALFESLIFPLMIMFSLPLAVVGAFGLLALTGNTLNMLSMIGMILLTGLVGKNAILLVDYTNTLRKRGHARNDALLEAGPTRLRPILMTTSALVLAMSPIALKLGEGSEWRAPMAVTVIGGLLTSTLLTLVLIPAVYTIMDDFTGVLSRVPSRFVRLLLWRPARRAHTQEPEPPRVPIPVGSGAD
jgi:hydrophobic/amphiphilic exporter-1 (mainly G- bacteria), HAE1 family